MMMRMMMMAMMMTMVMMMTMAMMMMDNRVWSKWQMRFHSRQKFTSKRELLKTSFFQRFWYWLSLLLIFKRITPVFSFCIFKYLFSCILYLYQKLWYWLSLVLIFKRTTSVFAFCIFKYFLYFVFVSEAW